MTLKPLAFTHLTQTLFNDIIMVCPQQNKTLGQFLWDTLEQECTIELGALAMSMVRFYLSQEAIFEYLDAVILRDVENTGWYLECWLRKW